MHQTVTAKIHKVTRLTAQIRELQIGGGDGGFPAEFSAGAHIRFMLPNGDLKCYSLIRWPSEHEETNLRVAVLLDPEGQGGSRFMHGLAEGDTVEFEPPKNDFPLDEGRSAVLVAGGIGVTPIISMATRLLELGQDFQFHYAARNADAIAYRDQLQSAFGANIHFHFDDDPETRMDLKALIEGLSAEQHLYICGPKGMIEAARSLADAAGIASERIHFELFNAPQVQEGDQAFEVEISSTGQVFEIPADKTIVEVLDAAGVDLIFDCQRGDCGICQTAVLSGVPDHRDVILSESEKSAGDVMQICVSRAKSPRLVLDI